MQGLLPPAPPLGPRISPDPGKHKNKQMGFFVFLCFSLPVSAFLSPPASLPLPLSQAHTSSLSPLSLVRDGTYLPPEFPDNLTHFLRTQIWKTFSSLQM